jgi:chemotaxis signal transduction protein
MSKRERAIFDQRALRLAQAKADAHDDAGGLTVLVCEVGAIELGIPAERIDIVTVAPPITSLPTPSDVVLGIVQVRGAVHTVIDLARWLRTPRRAAAGQVVVLRTEDGRTLALLVDRAQSLRTVAADDLAAELGEGAPDALPIRSVTNSLTTLLDVDRLFSHPRVDLSSPVPARSKELPSCS